MVAVDFVKFDISENWLVISHGYLHCRNALALQVSY